MSENDVKVYARFRPRISRESGETNKIYNLKNNEQTVEILKSRVTKNLSGDTIQDTKRDFTFDHIFPEEIDQEQLYNYAAEPLVEELLTGYNVTILAYGQTGSGKTYTMMGDKCSPGIIPRIISDIFQRAENRKLNGSFTIQCSYIEIYLERIRDLLNTQLDNLKLREIKSDGMKTASVYIEGCTVCSIQNLNDMLKIIKKGEASRTIAATDMNERSSRSHSVLIVTLNQTDAIKQTRKSSKLFLVDLAGSEDITRSGAMGLTLEQAKKINKSLSALSLVIQALTENNTHVPYRDSKLTRLLTDSLGGNAKTVMILACSPSSDSLTETISTLNFGSRTKKMKNCARINEDISYKKMVSVLKAELAMWISKYDELYAIYQNTCHSTTEELDVPKLHKTTQSLPILLSSIDIIKTRPKEASYQTLLPDCKSITYVVEDNDLQELPVEDVEPFYNRSPAVEPSYNRSPAVEIESTESKETLVSDTIEVGDDSQEPNLTFQQLHKTNVMDDACHGNQSLMEQKPEEPSIKDDLVLFQTGNVCIFGTDDLFTFSAF